MRHRVAGKRLNRSIGHRNALRRNLVTALFQHGRIETTEAKARAVRGQAEKLMGGQASASGNMTQRNRSGRCGSKMGT